MILFIFASREVVKMIVSETHESEREQYVYSPFKGFIKLLKAIAQGDQPTYEEMKKRTGYSNGKLYITLKDARIMKLADDSPDILPLGKEWLEFYEQNRHISEDLLKKASLNVPLFKNTYNAYPNLINYGELYPLFINSLPNEEQKRVSSSVKRYLEGIFGINISRGKRKKTLQKISKVTKQNIVITPKNNEDKYLTFLEETESIESQIREWIDKYGLQVIDKIYGRAKIKK